MATQVQTMLSAAKTSSKDASLSTIPRNKDKNDLATVKRNEDVELGLADKYGMPDHYLSAEKDTLWYHWQGNIFVKPIRFEAKTGTYVIALKCEKDADLGKHRHRGPVTGYTVKGSWSYKEYSWVAKPGDYIVENPGTIHTLYMDEDSEVLFTVGGSIEFFEPDGTLREIMDLFSFWRMYLDHCEKTQAPVNKDLWY